MQTTGRKLRTIVRVAVPIRHRSQFDYLCEPAAAVGSRVIVPFGRGKMLGVVTEQLETTDIASDKLRAVERILDATPAIPALLMHTLQWVAQYYQQPIGEVLSGALPKAVRNGRPLQPKFGVLYQLTDAGILTDVKDLSRAPVQQKVFQLLKKAGRPLGPETFDRAGRSWKTALRALQAKGLVYTVPRIADNSTGESNLIYDLTSEQSEAHRRILRSLDQYRCFLIQGVTGSGKTEVYLHVIREVLDSGGQALMLVPEIGLSPQLEQRVQNALGVSVASYHSGLTEAQRHKTWWLAYCGNAKVVIGTRSAVFLPFQNLKIIVIDEEHDSSFKQQERVRYHARSVALHRAVSEKIPAILGTATPSLETVQAARAGRAKTLLLSERATRIEMPTVKLIDLGRAYLSDGLSSLLLEEIRNRMVAGEQSLIFINRRGFAPVVVCLTCRWTAKCANCDSRLIYHHSDHRLHCHLCLSHVEVMNQCPSCLTGSVHLLGVGTQRVEQVLQRAIPGARVIRIDRDTTRSYKEFEQKLARIQKGEVDILVGTQMLSKGHHFPNVTLVGILNVDQGFYSMDFRAMEHLVQQVLQVAGRSGRAEKPGDVFIQTMHPDSEYFECIRNHDYLSFADLELKEREKAAQPPFAHYALLRANSLKPGEEFEYLTGAREEALSLLHKQNNSKIRVFDIVQSPIQKISNRFRAQLLVGSAKPVPLNQFLEAWVPKLEKVPKKGKLRWSLDVDPIDFS